MCCEGRNRSQIDQQYDKFEMNFVLVQVECEEVIAHENAWQISYSSGSSHEHALDIAENFYVL